MPRLAALAAQEGVRELDQQAGAVAGLGIAAASAAVLRVDQHLDALGHDLVGLLPRMLATKPTPQASRSSAGS